MARHKSSVFVGTGRFRNVEGLAAVQARVAALPNAVRDAVRPALDKSADELVAKIRSITPVDETAANPGQLRASVHKEAGDHELAVVVVEDGTDDQGRVTAKHVEAGHRTVSGGHVPAYPHFWPAYRVLKRRILGRVNRAIGAGVKAAGEGRGGAG